MVNQPFVNADDEAERVRPASTVMLLRDSDVGLEVFVLRRVSGMLFAPGMTVFPGGAVDPADHDPIAWHGPETEWWARRLGTPAAAAAVLVVAAVRELFEETGVLLAGPAPTGSPDLGPGRGSKPADGGRWSVGDADRAAVLGRRVGLSQVLGRAGYSLRTDLLRPWANWITPPGRTRRYDTFFFAAALPDGQHAELLTTEADLGEWRTPASLLDEQAAGTLQLMRPTLAMVTDLAAFGTVAQVMATERDITAVRVKGSRPPDESR